MVLGMPVKMKSYKGFFSMMKYGLNNRKCRFGINFSPSEYITHVPSENDTNNVVKEIYTLINAGNPHQDNHNIILNSSNITNYDKNLELINKLTTITLGKNNGRDK